uniref:Uncharacterized protein n=1 Tax=Panagrolaimus superbus TaxID=310955 RepID=A0A914YCN3_9BILA
MADQCAGTSENKGQNDHLNDGIPKPKAVKRQNECLDVPSCYGREFHGFIQPSEAEELLRNAGSGIFLF